MTQQSLPYFRSPPLIHAGIPVLLKSSALTQGDTARPWAETDDDDDMVTDRLVVPFDDAHFHDH